MKHKLFLIFLLCGSLTGWSQSITLTFAGKDLQSKPVKLNKIVVANLTKNWEETIYNPEDTILVMGSTGVNDFENRNEFKLSQNYPNPFEGATDFSLQQPVAGKVLLSVFGLTGRKITMYQGNLPAGTHVFRVILKTPQSYVLTARCGSHVASIKMINSGHAGENAIRYAGEDKNNRLNMLLKGGAANPFNIGDEMKYVGYASINGIETESEPIQKHQLTSEEIMLVFGTAGVDDGAPCPDAATVTDYDGNVYNTVQIGQQCWMKENLRTSRYADGTIIELCGGYDGAYRYYPGDNANNVPSHGYLYTHKAVMRDDPSCNGDRCGLQGICPDGWHVPSEAEWRLLCGYVGSQNEYLCDSNCGYIAKALSSERWDGSISDDGCAVAQNPSKNNTTGFSALPAGYRWSVPAFSETCEFGNVTSFWSITDVNVSSAIRMVWSSQNETVSLVEPGYTFASVRCVKDGTFLFVATVSTGNVSDIKRNSAVVKGNVTSDGGTPVTAKGVCWGTRPHPTVSGNHTTDGTGVGNFTSSLTDLTECTTYYICAYATNSAGTVYGEERSFTTLGLPMVTTDLVKNITVTTATCGGNVTSDCGATVTARGVCWSTSPNPTISNSKTSNGTGKGSFTSNLTELTEATTYYVRAYATSSEDTVYGEEKSFTTYSPAPACPGAATVTDADGNTYNTVQIGAQCWMKENLKTTKYADGTSISQGRDVSTTVGYWYYPENSSSNKTTYGLLYNWKAVMRNASSSSANPSGVQGICPTGWHVPSGAEWTQLTDYVSSQSQYQCNSYSGAIAKSLASTSGWGNSSNTCAVGNLQSGNNTTGFSAVPAGGYYGSYSNFGSRANFWGATEGYGDNAYNCYLRYNNAYVGSGSDDKNDGFSVRCLRDN